jgi:hypothetical protein
MRPSEKNRPGRYLDVTRDNLAKVLSPGDTIVHKDIPGLSFVVVKVIITNERDQIIGVDVVHSVYKSKGGDEAPNRTVVGIPYNVLQRDFNRMVSVTEPIG